MRNSLLSMTALAAMTLTACGGGEPPPPPEPIVRVDTVVVTREVAPTPPSGTPAAVCLSSGQEVDIRVTTAGDTLIGPRRVRMRDLGVGVGFSGEYAAGEDWLTRGTAITLDGRSYDSFGTAEPMDCDDIEIVGQHMGINLFAESDAASPYETIYVPVRPGVFQPYRSGVGRVRG